MTNMENPINVFLYFNLLWRRKWLFIVPIVILGLGAYLGSAFIPKEYMSSTVILVEEQKLMNPLINGLAVSTSVYGRLPIIKQQILSWDNMVKLVNSVGLGNDIKDILDLEDLVARLRRSIIISMPKNSNIVRISYQGRSPEITKQVVKFIADRFVEQNLKSQGQETKTAVDFIENQIALYKYKIKQDQLRIYKSKLNVLLVDSTDKHPLVIDLRKKISALEQELSKEEEKLNNLPMPSDPEQQKLYDDLKRDYERIREDAENAGDDRSAIEKDLKVNEDIYAMLKKRLETARITQNLEASKEGLRFKILDPPRLPRKAVKPNRLKYALFGVVLGFGVGLVLIVLAELLDTSFKGVQEAKSFLNRHGPIVGEIPEIDVERLVGNVRRLLQSQKKSV